MSLYPTARAPQSPTPQTRALLRVPQMTAAVFLPFPSTLKALLSEIGRTYVPVLLANGAALMAQAAEFETTIDGQRWVQPTFPYHGKCLMALRAQHDALPAEARATVDALLAGTGCERLFQ